jgi:putative transposase
MPWGLQRFHASRQTHFVTFCCYHRRALFSAAAPREVFEAGLERVRRSFGLCVYGYVVMPNHVHLLLSEPPQCTLADAIKSLKQSISGKNATMISMCVTSVSLWRSYAIFIAIP